MLSTPLPIDVIDEASHLTIRLLVADDHELVRDGLRFAFRNTEIEIIAEAADRSIALSFAQEKDVDVILLDIGWPDKDTNQPHGFQVLSEILDVKPELPVLIYSMHNRERYKSRARELGARGYVVKGVPNQTLVEAVRRAHSGEDNWFEYA